MEKVQAPRHTLRQAEGDVLTLNDKLTKEDFAKRALVYETVVSI